MIAFVALLAVAQADSWVDLKAVASSTKSAHHRFLTLSEAQLERLKKITYDAIAKGAHLRIDLDKCEADKTDVAAERDRARAEVTELTKALSATPPPAQSSEAVGVDWLLAIGIAGGALAAGALGGVALCLGPLDCGGE